MRFNIAAHAVLAQWMARRSALGRCLRLSNGRDERDLQRQD
ncbi:hypothetical protein Thpro_022931 [Acidihalobacter prosperus]|uniref:Uncharacterized protein n=1 Tax=Acidihalobacter prosperus TaxID=160660 RepID=A0A1A6C288_9GAMM|nr:hypothetical protein Thpro_022931 [Acidihalobacter prosperus]